MALDSRSPMVPASGPSPASPRLALGLESGAEDPFSRDMGHGWKGGRPPARHEQHVHGNLMLNHSQMTCFGVGVSYIEQLPHCDLLKVSPRHIRLSLHLCHPRSFPSTSSASPWAGSGVSSALAPALVGPWAVEGLPSSVEQEGREVEEGCSWRHLPASECVPSSAPLLRALARGLGRGTRERCGADKSPRTSQGDPAILFLRGQCVGPESQRRAPVAAVTHVHSHVLSLCLHWGEKEDGMRASMGPLLPWWYKLISQPGPTWR